MSYFINEYEGAEFEPFSEQAELLIDSTVRSVQLRPDQWDQDLDILTSIRNVEPPFVQVREFYINAPRIFHRRSNMPQLLLDLRAGKAPEVGVYSNLHGATLCNNPDAVAGTSTVQDCDMLEQLGIKVPGSYTPLEVNRPQMGSAYDYFWLPGSTTLYYRHSSDINKTIDERFQFVTPQHKLDIEGIVDEQKRRFVEMATSRSSTDVQYRFTASHTPVVQATESSGLKLLEIVLTEDVRDSGEDRQIHLRFRDNSNYFVFDPEIEAPVPHDFQLYQGIFYTDASKIVPTVDLVTISSDNLIVESNNHYLHTDTKRLTSIFRVAAAIIGFLQ